MTLRGCDISFYQDNNSTPQGVDFVKMKAAGMDFVIIRGANGAYRDEDFVYNWSAAKAAGILRGAYFFFNYWPGAEKPSTQIAKWYEIIASDPGEIPPAIDFECPNQSWADAWSKLTKPVAVDTIWQFSEMVTKRIKKGTSTIYTNPAGIYDKLIDASGNIPAANGFLKAMNLWIAHWGNMAQPSFKPWSSYAFWQYGLGKGVGPYYGVEGKDLDLDIFNGDMADLLRLCEVSQSPETKTLESRVAILEEQAKSHGWAV